MNYDNTGYGPILNLLESELSPFIKISERAYRYFIETVNRKSHLLINKRYFLINLLVSNAKNASYSIRLLSTWGQPIEGYALLRIRLEQLITSSYLIHDQVSNAVEKFISYYPVIEYNYLKVNDANENLKLALSIFFPDANTLYNERMNELRSQIEGTFQIKNDKYQRKWTEHNINKLAELRDSLVDQNDRISKIKMLDYYNTIYRLSSSIVHSVIASITKLFLGTSSEGVIKPHEIYVFIDLVAVSLFDIIQCYEAATYLKFNIEDKYLKLFDDYIYQTKRMFDQ